jgi:hypothetical protein
LSQGSSGILQSIGWKTKKLLTAENAEKIQSTQRKAKRFDKSVRHFDFLGDLCGVSRRSLRLKAFDFPKIETACF